MMDRWKMDDPNSSDVLYNDQRRALWGGAVRYEDTTPEAKEREATWIRRMMPIMEWFQILNEQTTEIPVGDEYKMSPLLVERVHAEKMSATPINVDDAEKQNPASSIVSMDVDREAKSSSTAMVVVDLRDAPGVDMAMVVMVVAWMQFHHRSDVRWYNDKVAKHERFHPTQIYQKKCVHDEQVHFRRIWKDSLEMLETKQHWDNVRAVDRALRVDGLGAFVDEYVEQWMETKNPTQLVAMWNIPRKIKDNADKDEEKRLRRDYCEALTYWFPDEKPCDHKDGKCSKTPEQIRVMQEQHEAHVQFLMAPLDDKDAARAKMRQANAAYKAAMPTKFVPRFGTEYWPKDEERVKHHRECRRKQAELRAKYLAVGAKEREKLTNEYAIMQNNCRLLLVAWKRMAETTERAVVNGCHQELAPPITESDFCRLMAAFKPSVTESDFSRLMVAFKQQLVPSEINTNFITMEEYKQLEVKSAMVLEAWKSVMDRGESVWQVSRSYAFETRRLDGSLQLQGPIANGTENALAPGPFQLAADSLEKNMRWFSEVLKSPTTFLQKESKTLAHYPVAHPDEQTLRDKYIADEVAKKVARSDAERDCCILLEAWEDVGRGRNIAVAAADHVHKTSFYDRDGNPIGEFVRRMKLIAPSVRQQQSAIVVDKDR